MQTMKQTQTTQTKNTGALRWTCAALLGVGMLLTGCGSGAGAEGGLGSAALLSGMPKCDPSLLHPRISVGNAAGLPGKMVVYVDGVMACVDEAAKVDAIITQVEGRATPPTAQPATAASR
jgi:hypothetical protein